MRTIRAECLDWILILGRRNLLQPPDTRGHAEASIAGKIDRGDILGGLIHEYYSLAA